MIGAALTLGILLYQFKYGVIHSGEFHANLWALLWPYILLVGILFLWHLARTPYLLHVEAKIQTDNDVDARVRERESKPEFKADIDCVVRNVLNEGHFFVHAHIVNLTSTSASIRRISLKNRITGELLPSLRFDKCFVFRNGETKLTGILTSDGTFTKKESRYKDEISDLFESLKLPLTKGDGKEGWLLFQKAYSLQETESPSLSLHLEDSFGGLHEGECKDERYEYGSFSK